MGDGTSEFGPFQNIKDPDNNNRHKSSWYYDYAYFVDSAGSWFGRGGHWNDGVTSGAFVFGPRTGGTHAGVSYRLVLAI